MAMIASRGTLFVDIGACSSVCRPEGFETAALDTEAVEELYTVDDASLKACGEIRPRSPSDFPSGRVLVEGITDNILAVN